MLLFFNYNFLFLFNILVIEHYKQMVSIKQDLWELWLY